MGSGVKTIVLTSGEQSQEVFVVEGDSNNHAFFHYVSGVFGGRHPSFVIVDSIKLPLVPALLFHKVKEGGSYETHFLGAPPLVKANKAAQHADPVEDSNASLTDKALRKLQDLYNSATDLGELQQAHELQFLLHVVQHEGSLKAVPRGLLDEEGDQQGFTRDDAEVAVNPVKDWLNANFGGRQQTGRETMKFRTAGKAVCAVQRIAKATGCNKRASIFDDDARTEEKTKFPCEIDAGIQDEVEKILDCIGEWNGFDVFRLAELTKNRPLQFTVWKALQVFDFFNKFRLKPGTVRKFLAELEARYVHNNPYHTNVHAADIVQCSVFFCRQGGLTELSGMGDLHVLTLLLSAAAHDVEHDGRNNAFHVNTQTELALRHNDISVLENHHCSVLFQLLQRENILEPLSMDQRIEFRQMAIPMILATDMTAHFENVAALKALVATPAEEWEVKDMQLLLKFCLHVSDISNAARPLPEAKKWTELVLAEFFAQGDEEKALDLTVSPLCDRETTSVPGSQIGFIKFIVMPSFEMLHKILPCLSVCVNQLKSNLEFWEAVQAGTRSIDDLNS
mmetsp:Transcript_26122/g.60308  ORF Transcript_26122/g.60308 Transcript_26122/m.60308 type:complete len:564 (+) Transcript_26122:30-1721(+)